MRKVVAAINMTIDGFCDHTLAIADDGLHEHYAELLSNAGVIIYGRITYHLMQSYWPSVVENPTGNKSTDEFAVIIQNVPKIVFSHTLKNDDPTIIGWRNARLADRGVREEVLELKQQHGNDIFVGSPSMIVALSNLHLIDEYQLCVHPVIAGGGLPLFKNINDSVILKLLGTKSFSSGAITLYYESKT